MLKIFRRKARENIEDKKDAKYPLSELEKYVDDLIEVHYVNQGVEKTETAILKHPPNENHFDIGDKNGQHIIYWDTTDFHGKNYFVKLIKDKDGKEIYKRNSV